MQYIIGIDIGTTHVKGLAVSLQQQVLVQQTCSYKNILNEHGELDIEDAWLCFAKVLTSILQLAGINNLLAVSFSTAMHGVMAIDENGNALTKLFTWADVRSDEQAGALKNSATGNLIFQLAGTPIHPMLPVCKIAWLKQTQPAVFKATHKFISVKEYIFYKLFGVFEIDHSLASATGFFNLRTKNWIPEALSFAGINENNLSKPVHPLHAIKNLLPAMQQQFGLHKQVPFIAGGSDGCLANLGSGCINNKTATLTIGTSGALRTTITQLALPLQQKLFTYNLFDSYYVTGGAINNGGIALQWWLKNMGEGQNITTFFQQIELIQPGCEGLICLPYFLGERAPVWDANAKGIFFGVTAQHTKAHFARALIEGTCFAFKQILENLEKNNNHSIKLIYATGGFIKSKIWLQLMADILNKKILATNDGDASAMGAVYMAMLALKFENTINAFEKQHHEGETYLPAIVNSYDDNYKIFRQLYTSTRHLL
jgi:gluconokinase